jgi:hypothetical protein
MATRASAKTVGTESTARSHGWRRWLRGTAIFILAAIGCLAFSAFILVHWVEKQVLTTDNWVAMVSPLPKQPVVSNALGSFISEKVFTATDVQQKISDALPPKAGFLAGPLTSQVQNITTKTSQRVVASDGFQTIWTGANRAAMNRLLTTARGQTPPLQARLNEKFDLNISDVEGQLSKALGGAASAIPALQPASKKALDVTTDLKAKPRKIHQVIRAADYLAAVLPLLVIAALMWAFAWSRRRRHTGLTITFTIIALMLLELIALKWLRQETLNQVHNPSNLNAVGYIYDTLVSGLKHTINVALILTIILTIILLLSGTTKIAQSFRQFIRVDRLKQTQAFIWWHKARIWVGNHEYYMWLASAVLVLAFLASVTTVNARAISNAILLILSLFAAFHIMATPPIKLTTERS